VAINERPAGARDAHMLVREAGLRDWPQIWPFWRRIVAAGRTHPYPRESGERAAARMWLLPPPARVYVAEVDGRVRAAMLLKPYRLGPGDHVAGADLMVDPDCWGRGVGRRLAEHVIAEARAAGYHALEFYSVVETNERAVALWHSLGFTTLAVAPQAFRHPDHGLVGVHLMRRPLTCPTTDTPARCTECIRRPN
jgi:ribosomal protein S18 acetylase RimI-like enzyme